MARTNFEELRVYRMSEQLADEVWEMVVAWEQFARSAVGAQLVAAADSIGANIADGTGRRSFRENRRFVRIARGSLHEVKHFLRRAYRRKLINDDHVERPKKIIDQMAPTLNAYLNSIGARRAGDAEERARGPQGH